MSKKEETQKVIAVAGYSGHFGEVIFKKLLADFSQVKFILLGRKTPRIKHENVSYYFLDFVKQEFDIPFQDLNISLLLDLSGPIKKQDTLLLKIAMENKIPYMDMAVHNSHLALVTPVWQKYQSSIVLSHFGFFPGISNLLIKKGFGLTNKNNGILLNTFPVYAGGGKNVAHSLLDMLEESQFQRCIIKDKENFFSMHSQKKEFFGKEKKNSRKKKRVFYKWEYPEISCFLRSHKKIEHLERYFSLQPNFANLFFSVLLYLWNLSWFHKKNWFSIFLKSCLKKIVYGSSLFFKSFVLSRSDPQVEMYFIRPVSFHPIIELYVKNAVKFHGDVVSSFVRVFFNKLLEKKITASLYTPEQIFALEEILPIGKHQNYELIVHNDL